MAEYRIVAKVDPQTAAGSQKVKQDLRGIQTEAKATETALNRSFDQAKFDKTIGGLVNRIDQLDSKLSGAASTSQRAGKTFDNTAGSIERMSAAEFRAAGGLEGLNKQAAGAAMSQSQLDAAMRRVLAATDAEALEQMKLNALLADAKKLLDAGAISHERYAQVQRLATNQGKEIVAVTGSQRIGMQQLGFQLGDVATMYSLGAKPAQIFASQIGQVSQALMLMGGGGGGLLGKVGGFLSGPWGIALTLGTIVLGPLIAKLFQSNDALADQMKKLKDDAKEAELTRQAHERWIHTLDALIDRQGKLADAMKDRLKVQGLTDQSDLQQAQRDQKILTDEIASEQARLARLKQELTRASAPIEYTGRGSEAALGQQALAISRINADIKAAEDKIARMKQAALDATTRITAGQIIVGEQEGKALVDLATKATQWGDRYQSALRGILTRNDQLRAQTPTVTAGFESVRAAVDKAVAAGLGFDATVNRARDLGVALQEGRITAAGYRTEMAKLAVALTAAAKAAEEAKRRVGDGVATFRTQEQAIGIAGRELQQAGFDISGNRQFRTTTGHANDAEHNRIAIDVNSSAHPGTSTGGIVEANVPDLKARFDAMARRYQARGYKVLWAGQVWAAGGNGPSGPITGKDKHYDHMHLEAPGTIVGKPTQASTEAQVRAEEGAQAKVAERAEDFVSSVAAKAAMRGLPPNNQAQLNAQIDEALAEFTRRFDREATAGEKATITKALTDADAREIAQRFDEAYVNPLKRLQALQGKTGLDREILNAQLEESLRLGRELTPVEKEKIENGIRGSDQLTRQAQILEQIAAPLAAYKDTIAALNALLAQGAISQEQFNMRVGELGASASQFKAGLPGQNSNGVSFAEQGAAEEAQRQRDEQLVQLQQYLDQGVIKEQESANIRLAIWQQYHNSLRQIEYARIGMARDVFGQLAQLQNSKVKEIAAVGKAAAVTAATIDAYVAINKALATLPPPYNVVMAAAIGVTALANVATIMGLKDGGHVSGAGGPRSDSIPAMLSNGEFVVNARATADNRSLLEAINSGQQVRQVSAGRAREASVQSQTMSPVVVPAPAVNLRMINVTDPKMVQDFFESPEGEQVFVNLVSRNADTIARASHQSGA